MSEPQRQESAGDGGTPDMERYTVTVKEASKMFDEADVPRSPRSIQRFCQRGHLSCYLLDRETDVTYLIDPESIESRIAELRQLRQMHRERHDATGRVGARSSVSERDTLRQDTPSEEGSAVAHLKTKIEALEKENTKAIRDKEIAEYVRDDLQSRYEKEAKEQNARLDKVLDRLGESQYKLGKAEAQLLALGSGDAANETEDDSETAPGQSTIEDAIEDTDPIKSSE